MKNKKYCIIGGVLVLTPTVVGLIIEPFLVLTIYCFASFVLGLGYIEKCVNEEG